MNSWVVYSDYESEHMDFKTDASLRRYCMQKKAKMGWRKLHDKDSPYTGMYVCVYPRKNKGNCLTFEPVDGDAKPVSDFFVGGEE